MTLGAGTTFDLNDFSDSLAGLSGAGTISFGPNGGGTLTVGAAGTNTTFSGVLAGTGDFVKTGTGTLGVTTSGAIPSTVTVTVQGGTLDLGSTNQTTGPVVVSNGSIAGTGTLTASGSGVASGYTYELRGGSVSPRLAGSAANLLVSDGYNYLTAVETYTGATQIDAGTLEIAAGGGLSGTSGVTVASGAALLNRGVISSGVTVSGTLSGTGSATGTVSVALGGVFSPGTDTTVGTFATGPLSLSAGGTYRLTIDSSTTTADKISATGSISLGTGVASLAATDLFTRTLLLGTSFTILQSTSGVSGYFASLPEGTRFDVGSNTFQISYAANGGKNVTISVVGTVVPEPSPGLLLLLGFGLLRIFQRRRNP
jgi:hypothetical protein